jgi:hypothetical protein
VILRIWRAKIAPARSEEYRRFERERCLPMLRRQPGFLGVVRAASRGPRGVAHDLGGHRSSRGPGQLAVLPTDGTRAGGERASGGRAIGGGLRGRGRELPPGGAVRDARPMRPLPEGLLLPDQTPLPYQRGHLTFIAYRHVRKCG